MSFFRVKIIKNSLIDDHGEFIYCAPPHFKLSEFTTKIQEYYTNIIKNPEIIEIIRDSAPIDVNSIYGDKVSQIFYRFIYK